MLFPIIYYCDYLTGPLIPFTIFYFIPIWLAGSLVSAGWAYLFAALSTLAVLSINLQTYQELHTIGIAWKFMIDAVIFFISARLSFKWTQLLKNLEEQATTDPLTKAKNRRAFYELGDHELSRSFRKKKPITLAFIDLDNFKKVNDQSGHEKGDQILTTVAATLATKLRDADILGRIGGDEFVILLTDTDPEQAKPIITRLVQNLDQAIAPFDTDITFSVGVVSSNSDRLINMDHLIAWADKAMYEIKHSTKNAVRFDFLPTSPT